VFLRAEPMEPVAYGDSVTKRARLHVQIRPLIGWTSAEGGFRGLYYNEANGTLNTHLKITADHPGYFLGDVCDDETPTIRAVLLHNVLETGAHYRDVYENALKIELTEAAKEFFEEKRLPIPRLP
jgi:hypothetical protein